MKIVTIILSAFFLSSFVMAQTQAPSTPNTFNFGTGTGFQSSPGNVTTQPSSTSPTRDDNFGTIGTGTGVGTGAPASPGSGTNLGGSGSGTGFGSGNNPSGTTTNPLNTNPNSGFGTGNTAPGVGGGQVVP